MTERDATILIAILVVLGGFLSILGPSAEVSAAGLGVTGSGFVVLFYFLIRRNRR